VKRKLAAALAAASLGGTTLGLTLSSTSATATPASGITTSVLAQALVQALNLHAQDPDNDWATHIQTRGQTDLYVVQNKFAPGATTGWHSHPGPSLILVVSGTITNYSSSDRSCDGEQYSAGQTFVDAGGSDTHMVRNNTTANAVDIAVQFIPHGSPRKIDEPVPANCSNV
jgi:quercetin dioxygenase-like cupin family protein